MTLTFAPTHRKVTSDFALALAEKEIYDTYGDRVSVWDKSKSLHKFGDNPSLQSNVQETIWSLGGFEVLPTGNTIDSISSSSASDIEDIRVEGHTVVGTGADAAYTFVVQTVTLLGQTKVTLPTPLARVSRANNQGATDLVGDVYVYEDTAISGGVPTDITKAHIEIVGSGGYQTSGKVATTLSDTDYLILTTMFGGAERNTSAVVDFVIEVCRPGGVFIPKLIFSGGQAGAYIDLKPHIIIPKNSDVRVVGTSNTNSVAAAAYFSGFLASLVM